MKAKGERILIFGDSLSHHGDDSAAEIWDVDQSSQRQSSAPGDLLASLLLEQGAAAVRIDANVGRSAYNFWTGGASHQFRSAQDLIADDQGFAPSKVIVFLGTNDLGLDASADQSAFQAIKDSFPDAEIWAVGPPVFLDANLNMQADVVYQTLRTVFGDAYVIDSRPISSTSGRAHDGIHFGADAAAAYASQLASTLLSTNPGGLWKTIAWGVAGVVGLVTLGIVFQRRHERKTLQGEQGEVIDAEYTEHMHVEADEPEPYEFGPLEPLEPLEPIDGNLGLSGKKKNLLILS